MTDKPNSQPGDAEQPGLGQCPEWIAQGFRRRSDLEPGQLLMRHELEIERLGGAVAKLAGLLRRRPSRPKCMVHLEWGPGELESEMISLEFMPRVGDDIEIEICDIADDPKRWRVTPQTVVGEVTRVQHAIHLNYGNDVGPNSHQSATVHVQTREA